MVLHVDALSVLFAFMGTCIGGPVLLYSIGYMAHDKSATRFYATMLVFVGSFITLVMSANLIIFICAGNWLASARSRLSGTPTAKPGGARAKRRAA